MATIQIELPDETAEAAREAGLLTSWALERLITDALRRRESAERLLAMAEPGGRSRNRADVDGGDLR